MRQSSANNLILEVMSDVMSLMNEMNRRGPKTVPCGTPEETWIHSEEEPSTTTLCDLAVRKERIQSRRSPLMP